MPSKSPAQARLMAACAHGAGYKACPPAKVAHEFNEADKGTGVLKGRQKGAGERARELQHIGKRMR